MVADFSRNLDIEQLATLRCKRMFGGYGLYSGEQSFGIAYNGCL